MAKREHPRKHLWVVEGSLGEGIWEIDVYTYLTRAQALVRAKHVRMAHTGYQYRIVKFERAAAL